MRVAFVLPIVAGLLLVAVSYVLFRRRRIVPRYFGVSVILGVLLAVSPLIYGFFQIVAELLGFVYTFVLAFGVSFIIVVCLMAYVILLVGGLRNDIEELNEEMALQQAESQGTDDEAAP